MRLILVEDEPLIALDLEMLARSAGHAVVGVADAFGQALVLAETERPDAALVDVNLSDGPTGPIVARLLLERGVAVGFVTGNPDQLSAADLDGAVGVLDKPFVDQGVFEMLDALEGRAGGDLRYVKRVA